MAGMIPPSFEIIQCSMSIAARAVDESQYLCDALASFS